MLSLGNILFLVVSINKRPGALTGRVLQLKKTFPMAVAGGAGQDSQAVVGNLVLRTIAQQMLLR